MHCVRLVTLWLVDYSINPGLRFEAEVTLVVSKIAAAIVKARETKT